MFNSSKVTEAIVEALARDNGLRACDFPREIVAALETEIYNMITEGADFDADAIELIAAGDSEEMEDAFSKYPSYPAASKLLDSLLG